MILGDRLYQNDPIAYADGNTIVMNKIINEIKNILGERSNILKYVVIGLIVLFVLTFLAVAYYQPMGVIWGLLMGALIN